MKQPTQAFRARYRAGIHPLYNPWLHGGFVLVFGVLCIGFFWRTLNQVQLIVVHSLLITLPAWWLLKQLNANGAGLFAGCMIFGYLAYEVFHACEHLPPGHPITRLPWIRQMRHLHELHHRHELMQQRNFNIALPLMDCHLSWEVNEYLPGQRWSARAQGDHGLELRVTYECQPAAGTGTRFSRTLEYRFSGLLMRLGNQLLFKQRIERESAASLLALSEMAQRTLPAQTGVSA